MKELNFTKASHEFTVIKTKDFSVVIRAWPSEQAISFSSTVYEDVWRWNVYANIFDSHPLFNNVDAAKNLPLHYGCTYDQFITTEPTELKYDWQKSYKTLKVGSDYQHYTDNLEYDDPKDGVPSQIMWDVKELVEALQESVLAIEKFNEENQDA